MTDDVKRIATFVPVTQRHLDEAACWQAFINEPRSRIDPEHCDICALAHLSPPTTEQP